jgi:hypothetical protein
MLFPDPGQSRTFDQFSPAAATRLPQVAKSAVLAGYNVAAPGAATFVAAPENDAVPGSFWRRKILAGRLPDPGRPGEVDISFTLAQTSHLGVAVAAVPGQSAARTRPTEILRSE